MKFLLFIFCGMILSSACAQDINQMDSNGERHGVWKKYFAGTKTLRYEGTFEHGKEVGVFKFYCQDCKGNPAIVKDFKEDGSAWVQFYAGKKLASEGKMIGKERDGEWVYFQKKSKDVMTREFYKNGMIEGVVTTYYPNGKITEETNYLKGLKEGANNYYSYDGVLLKKLQYKNDLLQGAARYFDAKGNVIIEGQYKNGQKHGLWKYYKNGQLEKEETFPKTNKKN